MSSQRRPYDVKFLIHTWWSRYNVEINSFKDIVNSITLKSRRESHSGFSTSILVLASTLYQLCISIVLPQIYRKIHLSDTQGWYSVIKFRPTFLSDTRKFPKVAFESLRKMSSNTLEFYSLKLSKGTATLQIFSVISKQLLFQKWEERFLAKKAELFRNKLFQIL